MLSLQWKERPLPIMCMRESETTMHKLLTCMKTKRPCINCLPGKHRCCFNGPNDDISSQGSVVGSDPLSWPVPGSQQLPSFQANAQQLPIIVQSTTPTTCNPSGASDVEQQSQVTLPSQSFSQTLTQAQLSSHPVLSLTCIPEPSSVLELNLLSQAISSPLPLPRAFEAPGQLVTQVSQAVSEPNSELTRIRKPCAVQGCPEFIAPTCTMGRLHMTLILQGLLPGKVPGTWLKEHLYFICINCQSLVADSHQTSHRGKCNHIVHSTADPPANFSQSVVGFRGTPVLLTFEDICSCCSR